MNKRRTGWVVGAIVLALLVTGVAVFAGNGFGRGATSAAQAACVANCDADGDGIPNGQDADWTRPADGSGCAMMRGNGQSASGSCAGAASCNGQGGRMMGSRGGRA